MGSCGSQLIEGTCPGFVDCQITHPKHEGKQYIKVYMSSDVFTVSELNMHTKWYQPSSLRSKSLSLIFSLLRIAPE